MKAILLVFVGVIVLAVACSKNSYTTRPQISLESINSLIDHNGQLDAKFKFTDKQGDLGGGIFTAIIIPLNEQPIVNTLVDTIVGSVPSFPNHSLGEFEYTLPANSLQFHTTQNDTVKMKFCVVDAAGNKSDTITSPVIVVLNPQP